MVRDGFQVSISETSMSTLMCPLAVSAVVSEHARGRPTSHSLEANASKATPGMQKFVQKVTDMIDNDLVGKVKTAHKQNQKVADALVKNFLQCKHSKTTADRTIGKLMSTAKTSSRHHKVRDLRRGLSHRGWFQNNRCCLKQHGKRHCCNPDTTCISLSLYIYIYIYI